MKRLFFAHLILIPVIRLSEPMHVFTTDDAHCFVMFSESFASTYFGVANVFPYKLNIYVLSPLVQSQRNLFSYAWND
jgi:hypothetical protein